MPGRSGQLQLRDHSVEALFASRAAHPFVEGTALHQFTCGIESDHVELRVRDEGVGIAPDMLPNVFDLFVQERQGIDRAQGGLGLGLAVGALTNLIVGVPQPISTGAPTSDPYSVQDPS